MARTLILTEKQLNEIIDGTPYLDTTDKGMPENMHLNQTSISGGVDTKDPKFKPTTDNVTKMMGPPTNFWPGSKCTSGGRPAGIPVAGGALEESYTKKEFEEKMLNELNSQLNNINMTATMPNDDNPANPFTISGKEGKLAKLKTQAKQSGDRETYFAIDKILKAQRERIKSDKKAKAAAGMPNQFQKPGGTRNNGGKAHTKKNNDFIHVIEPIDNNQ